MKILIGVMLVASLVTSAWSQTSKPSSAADLASYTGSDRERLLVEGAKREGKVVWYTTLAAEQNKQIANAFETKYQGVKSRRSGPDRARSRKEFSRRLRLGATSSTLLKPRCPGC